MTYEEEQFFVFSILHSQTFLQNITDHTHVFISLKNKTPPTPKELYVYVMSRQPLNRYPSGYRWEDEFCAWFSDCSVFGLRDVAVVRSS